MGIPILKSRIILNWLVFHFNPGSQVNGLMHAWPLSLGLNNKYWIFLAYLWNIEYLQLNLWNISGLNKIEFLQSHENLDIYQKSFEIIENYFGSEEEDGRLAPAVSSTTNQFQFNTDQSVPMGGFQF